MLPPRAVGPVALVLAIAIGILLRLAPSLGPRPAQFLGDGAAIARLAREAARQGRLPEIDSLAEAPAGRRLGPVLPPGLIVSAGTCQRALQALGSRDRDFDLALFGALCGGLIALPIFFWARATFPGPWAAPAAALLVVILPAHLDRTFGYFMRYDAPGSLAIATFLALIAAALVATRRRDRLLLGAAAGLALVVAAWTWRVSLLAPVLVVGFAVLWTAWRGEAATTREWLTPAIAIATLLFPRIEYLRAQRYVLAPEWLAVVAIALALWAPPARARRFTLRAAVLALAVAVGFGASRLLHFANPYATATHIAPLRIQQLLRIPGYATPQEAMLLNVQELSAVSPLPLLLGAMYLCWLGPWFALAAPLSGWLAGRSRPHPATWRAEHVFLAILAIAFFALSVMFYRSKVLLAPVVAVIVAGLLQRALERAFSREPVAPAPSRAPARGRRTPARTRRPGRALGIAVALGILASTVATAAIAVQITTTRLSTRDPESVAVLDWLRDHRAGDSPVAAPWGHGYEIESYAGRATLSDGFLESSVSVTRTLEFARAAFTGSPDSLAAFCRRYCARQLLVPPSTELLSIAILVADPIMWKLEAGTPLTPAEADRALVRMMIYGHDEPPFRKVFEHGLWRVYELSESTGAAPSRATSTPAKP